jgi:hypothetical protein
MVEEDAGLCTLSRKVSAFENVEKLSLVKPKVKDKCCNSLWSRDTTRRSINANKTVPDTTKKHASNFSTTKDENKGHAKDETKVKNSNRT